MDIYILSFQSGKREALKKRKREHFHALIWSVTTHSPSKLFFVR